MGERTVIRNSDAR